ncbi:hypothetical protein ABZ707_10845 [Streptomyces sp. NPDC006923]|uniref:hypothetical protein n=1 Tax=Streptomyces sp. NPDC006923 TaxID=3155355 RepID=UPI0033E96306
MTAPATDGAGWGFVALVLSLVVLAVGLLHASTPGPDHTGPPAPPEPVEEHTYTCYCHRDPVLVTIPMTEHRQGQAVSDRSPR